MENYDRLVEIQNAAMDSEDASVLQYAKTLDSLESKLNQISNSFQQFYMSIVNGPVIGSFLSIINNVITNLSSLPKLLSITKILSYINQIKTVIQLVFNLVSSGFAKISVSTREWRNSLTGETSSWAERLGQTIAASIAKGIKNNGSQISGAIEGSASGANVPQAGNILDTSGKGYNWGKWLYAGGAALSTIGLGLSQSTDAGYNWSTALSAAGGAATTVGMALTGNVPGAIIQGLNTVWELTSRLLGATEARIGRLSQQLEKDNVQRVEDKTNAKTLSEYIEKEAELRAARYDSAEAMEKYLEVSNEIAEKYPQYTSYIDESGNAIVNMSTATEDLKRALDAAADSSRKWGKTAIELAQEKLDKKLNQAGYNDTNPLNTISKNSSLEEIIPNLAVGLGVPYLEMAKLQSFLTNPEQLNKLETSIKDLSLGQRIDKVLSIFDASSINEVFSWVNNLDKVANSQSDLSNMATDYQDAILSIIRGYLGQDSYKYTKETGYYLDDLWSAFQELEDAKKTALSSNVYSEQQRWNFSATSSQKRWAQENNISSYVNSIAAQNSLKADSAQEYIDNFSQEQYQELVALLESNFIKFTGESRKLFEAYQEKPESITADELGQLIGVDDLNNQVQDAIVARWVDNVGLDYVAFEKMVEQQSDIISYSEWLAQNPDMDDSNEAKRKYYDAYIKERKGLGNLLTASTMKLYTNWFDENEKIIKADSKGLDAKVTEGQKKVAEQAKDIINKLVNAINSSQLDAVKKTELFTALFTDTGTYAWAGKFESLAEKYGLELQDSVYNAVYESLDSMINSAVEQAKSAMTKAEELSEKQSSGMSFEDASNYLHKLDWSDRDISQVYDIQNGKYYFKNYQEAQAAYLKFERDNLERYQEQFDTLRQSRISYDEGRSFVEGSVADVISLLPEGGLKDAALEWRKENAFIADDWEAFQAWVESRAKEAAEAADALDEQLSQLTKTTNLNSYKDRIQKFKANLTPDVFNEDWWKSIGSDTEWMESGVNAESIKAHLPKGWIFNTITGELTRSIEAIQRDINLSTSEEERAHFKAELETAKKSLAETIGEYTGRITQEQINYLQSQNIDVSGLESSKEWTKESVQKIADQFIEKGLVDVANQILVDFANNSREQAKSIKSSASSLLSDVANTSIEDLVSFMRNVLNNQEWAPDSTQLKEMTDALDGGIAGMIDYLNRQSTQYGIDLSAEIASFTEQQASSIKDSMEKVLTSLAQGEEVLVNDVVSVWESITNKQAGAAEREAIEKAMSQGWQAVADLLRNAIATSGLAADFANGLQDILASIIDAIRSEVNSVVSGIKSGFSGSLSRAEISEIAKNTGLGEKSILFGATQSLSGYKLSQNALLQLAGATSDKYGYGYDIAKTLVDEGIIKSYDEVNTLLQEAQKNTDKWGEQTKNVEKILKDVQGIMENSTTNDSWFNPDYYGAIDDKFQDYLDKVVKASSLLQSIQKGDKISRSDSEFMLQIVSQSDSFQKALKGNQKSIEDFYAALANHTDITTGAQDFSAALADMGMSFEDFGNSFAESVSNFADKRIEQLEAMKAMLLSQEQFADAMQELSEEHIDLFGNVELDDGTIISGIEDVERRVNEKVAKFFGDGSTFESVYGTKFTDIMLDAFNLTPEKMATFNSDQQKSVNEAAKAYMGFWAEAMSDPNNWVANDPIASFAKMMSQANAKWEQYTIDNPDTLTWYENPQLSADTTQFDEQVQQLRSSLQAKLEDISQGLDKNTPKLDVELGAISDKNKLQELDEQANKIKALRDELANNPTAATQEQLNAAIEEYNKMAEAAKKSAQDSQNALKETQKQVKELSDQLSALEKTYTARVNANVSSALSAVRRAIASINRMTATIQVNANVNSSSIKGTIKNTGKVSATSYLKKPSTTDKYINRVYYTGNANGLALYNGTKIAGKTLVGELGPEMAVYNNAFHILGQDGAEFVNLPDDAIVFNHKQTAGIINGQAGYRGKTINGGPAFAKGSLAAAIAAIDKEIALWRSMKDLTLSDMLGRSGGSGGGGGGGSGNTLKAHIEDLVEWYNLSRQIADIEQKINNIIAERENITDGHEYLRSLREQQHLLEGQVLTQRTLLGYQQKQLELQAEQINTNPIWSKFFEVDANGLLQYVMGNEVNGGKGTLSVLQQLNQMSGEQQLAYIKGTGYSYIDNDGNVLDGEELIAQFYTEAQEQIDKYDELRDTVEETDEALSKLQTSIDEIEQEIRKNQEDLEQAIYDSIVSAWEKQISDLTEQMNLLKEANDAYVNGLSDALAKEKNLYSQNQSTADREQLQRQLSLLRRAGGSASQIADLEEQLNDSLKNEYFSHQQDSIDSIKEANQKQIDALNKQIKIQQETLDFQKENGVLWSKVYEILARSDNEILEFLKGNNSDFFSKSALVQRDMLEEWAKQIGIYKENNDVGYIGNINTANENFAAEAWNSVKGADKQKMFDVLDKTTQAMLQDYFASAFANAKLQGMGSEDAYEYARNDMYQKLYQAYNQKINADSRNLADARANSQPTVSPSGGGSGEDYGSGGGGSYGGGYSGGGSSTSRISITVSAGNTGGYPTLASSGGGTSASVSAGTRVVIAPNAKSGYAFDYITYNGTKKSSMSIVPTGNVSSISIRVFYKRTGSTKHIGGSPSGDADHRVLTAASGAFVNRDNQPALLHKGEGVFTAQQTSALISLVDNYQKLASGNISASLIASLSGATRNYSNINARNNAASSVVVNPGAVVIQVDQLNDKYDVDDLATDVFNKITTIASKATNRGVNRR